MPKDYAKRSRRNQIKSRTRAFKQPRATTFRKAIFPPWIWVIIILIIALLVIFVYRDRFSLKHPPGAPISTVAPIVAINQQVTEKLLQGNSHAHAHVKFVFNPQTTSQSTSSPTIILQVASVNQLKIAKELQLHLKKQGYRAHIRGITSGDATWFRVQLGPYANKAMAEQVQQRLGQLNIDGVVVVEN